MKKYIITLLFSFVLSLISAQQITGTITTIFGEPLIGANVSWSGTDSGVSTDEYGKFKIEDKKTEPRILVFSYIGFKSDSIQIKELTEWNIQLIEDNTLSTVDITAKGSASRYMDAPAKTEVLGTRELERAACCSLAGCFNTNASVDAQTTNVITDAKELQILGLSGVYNQVLLDGLPLVQGASYTFGASSIPGTMIEEIYVSKGANSVIQGYESISGQINIIPKSPEKSELLFLNAFINSYGETHYNANYMHKASKWSNFTTVHGALPARKLDGDGDGFQDVAKVKRLSLFNKWIFKDPKSDKFKFQLGARYWTENRIGGQTEYSVNKARNEVYGQNINIDQVDVYTKMNWKFADLTSIIWETSGFHHKQDAIYGLKDYDVTQTNLYSNLAWDYNFGANKHNYKLGFSLRKNNMTEEISFIENPLNLSYAGSYDNNYFIPGFFTEGVFYLGVFTVMGGIRTDYHREFGWKTTPRMLIRADISENTDIRFSAGKGFRRVHLFSERVQLLASNRDIVFENKLEPEEAINLGVNLIQKFRINDISTSFIIDGYWTLFQNQIFPDFDRSVGKVYIDNFTDKSESRSIQVENKWSFTENFDFKWAYNYQWAAREIDNVFTELPMITKHRLMAQISLSTSNDAWQVDLTYKWKGKRRLPDTSNYPDEFKQPSMSKSFSIADFQLTKRWTKWEIYTGVENIFDFRQSFPILSSNDPFGQYFDSSFNWGPTKGRELYIGFRYKVY